MGILLQRFTRPDRLFGEFIGIEETEADIALFLFDLLVATGEVDCACIGILSAELQIEAVAAGVLQQVVAPAVIQHPVGEVVTGSVKGHQLLLGIVFGHSGGDPQFAKLLPAVLELFDQRDLHPQAGAAVAGSELQPLQADMSAVEARIAQQLHVFGATVELKLCQLFVDGGIQLPVAYCHGSLELGNLLFQQMKGHRLGKPQAEKLAAHDRQDEQQQSDPDG